jgi:hypothetical protein
MNIQFPWLQFLDSVWTTRCTTSSVVLPVLDLVCQAEDMVVMAVMAVLDPDMDPAIMAAVDMVDMVGVMVASAVDMV